MHYDNIKKKKKTVIYLISGIIIAGVGAIAYFTWTKNKPVENKDNSDRNDDPDKDPEPTNKNKAKIKFVGKSLKDQDSGDFDSYKFLEEGTQGTENIFYISKNHPRIKELLSQNKLQKDKKFTIRYGRVDKKSDSGFLFTFNENNQELEILKLEPDPNPNPQPRNKGLNYVSTKINDNTYKYHINVNGNKLDFANFIIFLKTKDKDFFNAFQGALKDANAKFPAYFWKCPPVSKKTFDKPFEFVVIRSDGLNNITQDWKPFKEYLAEASILHKPAISFPNNSNPSDAILVSPALKPESGEKYDYKNISQFTKNAPDEQQQELWKEVANKLVEELEKNPDSPRWLNTHGLGVHYLHVRIDEKPKYYGDHEEYKKWK